ncbi:helix-turn-helix domain-containing protein [Nocardiopsis alba]|uniref:helix-turn-helix domain-containing protein n=1 Tax=Nocardiopsis alba TaxID=53437 RepID=UPI00367113F2
MRWNSDISQTALARITGLAQSTLSGIISGKIVLKNLDKINEVLDGFSAFRASFQKVDRSTQGEPETATTTRPPQWSIYPERLDLEEFSHELKCFERDYTTVPSTAVLAQAGPLHGRISQVCSTDSEAQRLRARSHLLMGQVIWDASQRRDTHTASGHLSEAAVIAQTLGDHSILAHALLRSSYIPLYGPAPDPFKALIAARRAMITARDDRGLQSLAALHISEAQARLHNSREAEEHLDHAATLACEVAEESGTQEGRHLRIAGSVHLELERPGRAQHLLEQAVHVLADRPKTRGIALANLAMAHVRQQEVEGATLILHHAMDIAHTTHAGGATSLIANVVRELSSWRTLPAVIDIQDRFVDLITR